MESVSKSVKVKPKIPFNSPILKWARESRRISIEESARHIGVSPEKLEKWELGELSPTVKQGRKLATFYKRSFLEFLGESIPRITKPQLVPDFRLYKDVELGDQLEELEEIEIWAESCRQNALDLYEINSETAPVFQFHGMFSEKDSPEAVAEKIRKEISFSIDDQIQLKAKGLILLPEILRDRFEGLGIMVLKNSSLANHGARGLCLSETPLPTIVYSGEAPTAQSFTLAHEFAHILLGKSGIIGPYVRSTSAPPSVVRLESWCDRFAGAFLMPAQMVNQIFPKPDGMYARIADSDLSALSRIFCVSNHAMLVRLVQLNYVDPDYYWLEKRHEFISDEREYRSFGRSKYYGSRYKNSLGNLYTKLVLEAWGSGKITNHNAAEFMGIKNPRHLVDIKNNFSNK